MKHAIKLLPAALLALSGSAQAAVTITMKEVGNDVILTASGSIDTDSGLTSKNYGSIGWSGFIAPSFGMIATTKSVPADVQLYTVETSPENFGSGGSFESTTGEGDGFWVTGLIAEIPQLSGTIAIPVNATFPYPVDFELTFENQTLSSLGANPGRYEWTWGTAQDGVNGDSVTLCIGDFQPCHAAAPPTDLIVAPVPALGAFSLMGLAGAIGAAGVAMTRRRKR